MSIVATIKPTEKVSYIVVPHNYIIIYILCKNTLVGVEVELLYLGGLALCIITSCIELWLQNS